MRRTPVAVVVCVWLIGGALSVLHLVHPMTFEDRTIAGSAVIETLATTSAVLLSALAYGRWRQRGLVLDVVASVAFAILALGNLCFTLLPILVAPDNSTARIGLSGLVATVFSSAVFALGTVAPQRRESVPRRRTGPPRGWSLLVPLVAVIVCLLALVLGSALAAPMRAAPWTFVVSGETSTARGLQLAAALLMAITSMQLAHRAKRGNDAFYGWLAAATALWALARVDFSVTTKHALDALTIGDCLRLLAYVVAVVAACVEVTGYWHKLAQTAVLEERRRIARELHDGLAQELAFIATNSRAVAATVDDPRLGLVARAGERALDESRRAIAALTRPIDEPLDVALAQTAEELGGRMGVRVLLDLESGIAVSNDVREALLRIAREAITNAGRHGRPSKISVSLVNHDGVSMRVADDGRGFRPDDPKVYAGGRYGVAGMRERVEALGGRFALDSRPYGGTRVEVWVP